ncbi:MAG TPA: hypothetical protein VJT31_09485, partial [Rugosimonospora sp.]|nr:hypothetical protein [Rugosimonospora sp.]
MPLSSQLPSCPASTRRAAVLAAAIGCLDAYVDAWVAQPPEQPDDPGPAVLAALVGASTHPTAGWYASRALTVWRHGFHRGTARPGLYGGQAGYVAGLSCVASSQQRLRGLVEREARVLAQRWTAAPLAGGGYTLVDGLPGAVLALSCDPGPAADRLVPLARRLAAVPDWP